MLELLDNIAWHTLAGPQAPFSRGDAGARRYAPGFSPIVAFADNACPDFDALAALCPSGEHFYCDGWAGTQPDGWEVHADSTMFKMVWQGEAPDRDPAPDAVRLDASHVGEALELVALTHPGPFGPRTIELGEYYGVFDGSRLVAMAGERMQAGSLREISGVCTRPAFQGRGLARRLVAKLVRLQVLRDEIPFLHVMRDNAGARRLYAHMGFRDYRESVVRVLARA